MKRAGSLRRLLRGVIWFHACPQFIGWWTWDYCINHVGILPRSVSRPCTFGAAGHLSNVDGQKLFSAWLLRSGMCLQPCLTSCRLGRFTGRDTPYHHPRFSWFCVITAYNSLLRRFFYFSPTLCRCQSSTWANGWPRRIAMTIQMRRHRRAMKRSEWVSRHPFRSTIVCKALVEGLFIRWEPFFGSLL